MRVWMVLHIALLIPTHQTRPYHEDSTGSCQITEVKPLRAELVLRWVTTLEPSVLCLFLRFSSPSLAFSGLKFGLAKGRQRPLRPDRTTKPLAGDSKWTAG